MANRWLRRKRNSLGYGVQSPSDFYFVQHVLREKSPYYAYAALTLMNQQYQALFPCYSDEVHRLLFRLANYIHPDVMVEIGTSLSVFAMSAACPLMRCVTINKYECCAAMQALLDEHPLVEMVIGDEVESFRHLLHELGSIQLLHVAHTANYKAVVETALPYVTQHTLFIIEDIHTDKEKQDWWRGLRESNTTGISYDLGPIGLLFFDKSRYKDSYWINLRS